LPDRISKQVRSRIMSSIRSKDTKPEIAIRRALWMKGYRYRTQFGAEKIDIAFLSRKIAIFVDGCFWHGCPTHSNQPKTNQGYWFPKLKKNIQRDIETNARLKAQGWTVLRFWEHEIGNIDGIVHRVGAALLLNS
jgi:DNA mismatch endonuclease, patch repair protein